MSNTTADVVDNSLNPIFYWEQKLITDINDFNTKYLCYNRSVYTNVDNTITINGSTIQTHIRNKCNNGTSFSLAEVEQAKNTVITDINKIKTAIATYGSTEEATKIDDYEKKYKALVDISYNHILAQRKDLDRKLAELYGTDDGINNYYINQYRATMFSKIMLTILVTSLVYYTFMKIIKK